MIHIYIIKDRFITKQINDTIVIKGRLRQRRSTKVIDRVIKTNNVKVSLQV